YIYIIGSGSGDTTPPTVTVSPVSGSTISAGSTVTINATDASGIYDISYRWNNESYKTVLYKTSSATLTVTAPSTNGTNILQLYVRDNSSNYNTAGWVPYTYTIGSGSGDTTPPTVTLSPSAGSTISAGSSVTIYATDASGIYDISYRWDNQTYKTVLYKTSTATLTVTAPSTNGTHGLQLYVRDNSSNYNTEGWKTYYYTIGSSSDDYTAPVICVSPIQGDINAGANVTIEATDDSGIYSLSYYWDNNSSKTVYTDSTITTVPSTVGTHYLYASAKDNSSNKNDTGWRTYIYNVVDGNGDVTPPTTKHSPDTRRIQKGKKITLTATDASGIQYMCYKWDDGTTYTVYSDEIVLYAPNKTGTRDLYVMAVDNSSNHNNSGWSSHTYRIVDDEDEDDDDDEDPTITVTPPSGSSIQPSSTLKIYAYDDSDIDSISYYWDNNSSKTVDDDTVTVTAPSTNGVHILYAKAIDDSSNSNSTGWKAFTYTVGNFDDIIYPGGPTDGTINPGLKALKLEIRNAMDRVKYSVNEEIQYYIDYYNASGSEQNNLQVVFNIPDGFEVTDYNKGTKVSNTVVWSIGKLASLQSGRLYVKVKCTTANTFERIVLVTAEMRQGGTLIDTSMLRNLIFTSNIKGYHQKYIIGYPGVVFKPERGVTRAEFAAMLVRIFNVSTGTSVGVNPYHDIHSNKSHWAYDAIVACTREGLFTGYPDGTFRPESVVTRAEFTTVLARKLNLGGVKTIWIHANDLKNHWAMNEMEQLIRLKIIQGYTDGSAKPDRQISRSEAVTLLNRYNFRGSLNTSTSSFKDVSINHWAHKEIEEAARNHAYYRDVIGNETVSN
ncbi:MAG: S-layer homology domain-containing protein, partial [Ignavibacteriales bacterium]